MRSESKTTPRFLATDLTCTDSKFIKTCGVLAPNIKMSDLVWFNCKKKNVGHPTTDIIKTV